MLMSPRNSKIMKLMFVVGILLVIASPYIGKALGENLTYDWQTNMESMWMRQTMLIESCIISVRWLGCIFAVLSGMALIIIRPEK